MKLEIPIIVGFDDMESLLDDLKKLQTYKCFEGAEEVLVDIEDVAKVLMNHVKAKKSVKSNDLICREDAIDALADYIHNVDRVMGTGHLSWDDCKDSAESVLEGVPTAQPDACENTCEIERKSNDMIRRADALDIIKSFVSALRPETIGLITDIYDAVLHTPSAQSEIIRCKNCVKRDYCRTTNIWAVPPDDDWYCADAERKTDE